MEWIMSDMKSKLPDLKELAAMSSKLFGDIKNSVEQIVQDYKDLRAQSGMNDPSEEVKPEGDNSKPDDKVK